MKDKTWYPNIETDRWLAMHPTFKEDLPLSCICGKEVYEVSPFVTAYSLGVSTGDCDCGVKDAATLSKPRNKKLASELVQLVADLAR